MNLRVLSEINCGWISVVLFEKQLSCVFASMFKALYLRASESS